MPESGSLCSQVSNGFRMCLLQVSTRHGANEGIPELMQLLRAHQVVPDRVKILSRYLQVQ